MHVEKQSRHNFVHKTQTKTNKQTSFDTNLHPAALTPFDDSKYQELTIFAEKSV